MSPTTLRPGARALGALLTAVVLVGAPSAALADDATPTPTASGSPSPSATEASPSPSPTATPSETPSDEPTPSATVTPAPTATAPAPGRPATTAPVRAQVLPGPAEPETQAAAGFVARTLTAAGGYYDYPDSDWFDGGNTIDAVLALEAANVETGEDGTAVDYLVANVNGTEADNYIGPGAEDYVGPVAKTLIAATVEGLDLEHFGDVDLVAQLHGLETPSGRFSDKSQYGDNSITITQALALVALHRAGEPVTTPSVRVLLDQQCADGGFRGKIGDPDGCVSDPDATAFAAQALLALDDTLVCWDDVDGTRAAAATAATRALDHLAAAQDASGGLASSAGTPNANTTGVAGQAFLAGGRTTEATDAAAFVASLQYDDSAPAALRGGIAFSDDTRSSTVPADTDIRATPQAALLLAGKSLLDVIDADSEFHEPATVCPAQPTSTPTTTPTSSTDPTTTAPAGDGGSTPSTPVAAAPAGALAQTGTDPLLPVLLGFALVLLGAVAVVASRRRGAHA